MAEKKARPIPAKHEARAAELRGQGFNVWAKEDGSLGWGKPKAKPAPEPKAEPAADAGEASPPAPGDTSSVAGAIVAVVAALAGLGALVFVGWKRLRAPKDE